MLDPEHGCGEPTLTRGVRTEAVPELVAAGESRERWFIDENCLGVAKALAYVRGDVT